jgi:hypothetical protein
MINVFSRECKINALRQIKKFNTLNPGLIARQLKISFARTKRLIDTLFIQGYLSCERNQKILEKKKICNGYVLKPEKEVTLLKTTFEFTEKSLSIL